MDEIIYRDYLAILKEELIPAMGCTEPISIAYTAASAMKYAEKQSWYSNDGERIYPDIVTISVSGNIIKNVKSVTVPNSGGLKGIEAAAAAGIVAGDADKGLEVLSGISLEKQAEINDFLKRKEISVNEADTGHILYIEVKLEFRKNRTDSIKHSVCARTAGRHIGLYYISVDGETVFENIVEQQEGTDHSVLSIEGIIDFADNADVKDVQEVLDRQIEFNTKIAKEGLKGNYGAAIGRTLLLTYGDTVHNRAKAWAAAGSDARMSGCELPVVINSGSGNQGITASLPVIVYAREMKVSEDLLYRALLVSNLSTIHLKTGIGCLSAYCGAISAGCGAGAGVMYLHGGRLTEIAHTIVNALAINSGVVCDGAKASCAAKIASAVEAGLLGMQMYMHGKEFYSGEGIVSFDVEKTIENINILAKKGMLETDHEIIRIMLGNKISR